METPTLPFRITAPTSWISTLGVTAAAGSLFVLVVGANPDSFVRNLLAVDFLGYKTKLTVLAALALIAGYAFHAVSELLNRVLIQGVFLIQQRFWPTNRFFNVSEIDREFIFRAFRHFDTQSGPTVMPPFPDEKDEDRWSSIVLTLLLYYTTLFQELGHQFESSVARTRLWGAVAIALFVSYPRVPPPWKGSFLFLGLLFLILSLVLQHRTTVAMGRIISAGFLREQSRRARGDRARGPDPVEPADDGA